MQNNRLIAYNILKKNIISNGFCTGCGACEATCPVAAIQVKAEHARRLFDCSQSLELCPICNEVCPHSQALLLRSLEAVADAPVRSEAIGYLRKALLAQANDPKIREGSADGAVVSSLLTYGISSGLFDGTVVTQSDEKNPMAPKPHVASTSKEIASARGSKFFPSAAIKAYGSAVLEYGKENLALVGTPCQILALRKIDAWGHKIGGRAKIAIGLFCFGTFSTKPFLNYLEKNYSLSEQDIIKMQLSHHLTLYTKQGTVEVPLTEAKKFINIGCKTCIDYTSEVADISVGNAYPLKEWSVVIIRTKAGEEFFDSAVRKGVINTRSFDKAPEVFERLIVDALQKRTAGLIKASKLEKQHRFVPVRLLRETESLAGVKVEDIMTKEVITIPSSMTVNELLTMMATRTYIGYPVIDKNNELIGVVTMEEATKVDKGLRWKTQIGSIARKNIDVCYPQETALDVFKKMSQQETGRVFVLDPANPKKIVGIVTKRDLMHALMKQAAESVQ